MLFSSNPKDVRYEQASDFTQLLLKAMEKTLKVEDPSAFIRSTTGGGIEDISGMDAIVTTMLDTYTAQVSVRPEYHPKYKDLLWERWEYPEGRRVAGRSLHYQFDWWWHFVRSSPTAPQEFDCYVIHRDALRDLVSQIDESGKFPESCSLQWVRPKPGDPAKDLYCLGPESIASSISRVSIE